MRPTSRLSRISTAMESPTSTLSFSMYWNHQVATRAHVGGQQRDPFGADDACVATSVSDRGLAVIARAHRHDRNQACGVRHVNARVGELGGAAKPLPVHRLQLLARDPMHAHAAAVEREAISVSIVVFELGRISPVNKRRGLTPPIKKKSNGCRLDRRSDRSPINTRVLRTPQDESGRRSRRHKACGSERALHAAFRLQRA